MHGALTKSIPKQSPYMDMTRPIPEYWIASSHNTYVNYLFIYFISFICSIIYLSDTRSPVLFCYIEV